MRILFLFFLLFTLTGCRESAQPTPTPNAAAPQMTLQFDPDPPTTGDATLIVTLTGADGQPVDGAQIAVRGDMTHAGMTPVVGEGEDGDGGIYRVPFRWTMGGDWILTVTAMLPDATTLTQEFTLTVDS